jgi:hypothetical protein
MFVSILSFFFTLLFVCFTKADPLTSSGTDSVFMAFPQPDNPNTAFNESNYGNPAIVHVATNGKMYIGLFGNLNLVLPTDLTPAIGEVGANGQLKILVDFPIGGYVEKMVFLDGFLYVNLNYQGPYAQGVNGITTGIVKIDVSQGTYTQIYSNPSIGLAGGLAIDEDGYYYIGDPTYGQILQIDPTTMIARTWIAGTFLQGDGSIFSPTKVGVNAVSYNPKSKSIEAMNFDKGTFYSIPILVSKDAGSPTLLVGDTVLKSADGNSRSPKNKLVFTTNVFGSTFRIDMRMNPATVTPLTGTINMGFGTVNVATGYNFENTAKQQSLFVSNLGFGVPRGGVIYEKAPVCTGTPPACSFWDNQ